jgi:hypothetical protein
MALHSAGKVYLGTRRRDYFARKPKLFLSKEPVKKKDEDDEEEDWEEDEDWEDEESEEDDDDWEEDDDDW